MALITIISVVIEVVNFFTLHSVPGCLSGSLLFGNPIFRVFTLITNYLLHPGFVTLAVTLALFVPLGSMFERRLGSISFLYHFFIVLGIPMAIIYLFLIYIASFTFSSFWTSNCAEGLLPMAFAFLTVECVKAENDFGPLPSVVPPVAYPWIMLLVVYFLTFIPFIGISVFLIYNIAGILTGFLYAQGFLNIFVPSSSFFTSLEDSFLFSWMLRLSTFVPNAGVITLPNDTSYSPTGAGPSESNLSNSAWFFDRFRAFTPSRAGYGALGKDGPNSAVDEDEEALLRGP
ncbi:hypothetical protein HDU67_007784 [Dinochytrium kinnereticum]|nr:hypothetical protein HDU67_007784 [Dinochytrium kinnereticum]